MSFHLVFKRILLIILALIVLLMLMVGIHLGYNFLTHNVHEVIPDKIYRSGQLDKKELTSVTEKYHIKSMINLRGAWSGDSWYDVESRFAAENHIDYHSIRLSAYKLPPKQKIRDLVFLLETVPKPIIFHCEGGADRTGMAAAISLILFSNDPSVAQIKEQASWHYNAISRFTVGYQMLRNYFEWLKKNNLPQSKKNFIQWLNSNEKMQPYEGWFL